MPMLLEGKKLVITGVINRESIAFEVARQAQLAGGLVPFDPERVVALRRVGDVVFKRPVKLGDTLRVTGKVLETNDVGEEAGLVGFAWNVVNQDERVVCRARVEVLWRRDRVAGAADSDSSNEFVAIPL